MKVASSGRRRSSWIWRPKRTPYFTVLLGDKTKFHLEHFEASSCLSFVPGSISFPTLVSYIQLFANLYKLRKLRLENVRRPAGPGLLTNVNAKTRSGVIFMFFYFTVDILK